MRCAVCEGFKVPGAQLLKHGDEVGGRDHAHNGASIAITQGGRWHPLLMQRMECLHM